MFSHIFAEQINFCCNFRNVTYISLVSPRISCNAETRIYGLVYMFTHIMWFRNINLSTKILALHDTRRLRPLNADYLISGSCVTNDICMKCGLY